MFRSQIMQRNCCQLAKDTLFAVALTAILLPVAANAAPDEVRGTWLTTTGPDHIRSGFNTEAVMGDLKQIGLNTVYVETWKNGYTNFPSQTLANLTGGANRSPFLGSRDLVEETLMQAHRAELNYIGWFEYGFASQFIGSGGNPSNPISNYMKNQGWLLQDRNGQYGNSSNGFAWMNPAVPEVRQFLIDITLETVENYDLDGIQFDDRLAWPREFGWDATTASLYQAETGRSLPSSVSDVRFRAWRQSKVTEFAEELVAAVKEARPDLHVSVSPSVTSFSDVNYNAEWPEWQDDGIFDEYAVQVYRDNYSSFNSTLTSQTAQFPTSQRDEFVVGLRANGSGANTPYADLEQMINRTRQIGAAGHAIFYSKGVRDDYGTQLQAFYDAANTGHAENPYFGDSRFVQPPVGTNQGGGNWEFNVTEAGVYRIAARTGTRWNEVTYGYFTPGVTNYSLPGASEAELLIDLRPVELPDFNTDGVVDAADYTVWRDTLGSTSDLRADANRDGRIDSLDYSLWKAFYGQAATSASSSVPEPTTALLAFLAICATAGSRPRPWH